MSATASAAATVALGLGSRPGDALLQEAIAPRDHPAHGSACLRVVRQRCVIHALLDFELEVRFFHGLVNISRHSLESGLTIAPKAGILQACIPINGPATRFHPLISISRIESRAEKRIRVSM